MKYNIRESDIGCRYGGEEFVLILPEATLEVTQQRAERLRQDVKISKYPTKKCFWRRLPYHLGWQLFLSMGPAVCPCCPPLTHQCIAPKMRDAIASLWLEMKNQRNE